ncbi:hypothetical protein HPB51_002699 [Rhipicephalus microplus]|uniref:Uncharacterized protein n=1 Tax=Rhipicephalus microplus TaxID=6941 RepID=A0A9J6E6I0_RHIMP|nr:hypothetical protein HPB51_002699 [Rhipicephalus microplus]
MRPPKPKQPQTQAGHNNEFHQDSTSDPPRTKNLHWFCSEEEEDAYKSANGKHSSQSYLASSGQKPCSPPKKSAPTPPLPNLHPRPSGESANSNDGNQGHIQQALLHPVSWAEAVAPKSACTPPITQNAHYQAVIIENKYFKQRLAKYENKIAWLEKQVTQLMGTFPKPAAQAPQNLTSNQASSHETMGTSNHNQHHHKIQ